MGNRRKTRELAIQVLFALDYKPGSPTETFDHICENFDSNKDIRSSARQLVLGVCLNKDKIDDLISRASRNWRIARMPGVDRTILRLATFEMLCLEDIPLKVSIDEAVEIGKKFGSDESSRFINGILDNLYNLIESS